MLLKEVFDKGPRIYPEKVALIERERRFTYAEAGKRWNQLANALLDLQLKKGETLCVLLQNCIEIIDSAAAAAKTNAVVGCINYHLGIDALKEVLVTANCRHLILGCEFAAVINSIRAELPQLETCISVGGAVEGMYEYESLLQKYSVLSPQIEVKQEDLAVISYTSGSTGAPKGALLTRSAFVYRLSSAALDLALEPEDKYIVALPLFHVGASTPALAALFRCATVVIQPQWDVMAFCDTVQKQHVNKTVITPGLLNFVLNFPEVHQYDLGSFRLIQYGGSPMAVEQMKRIMALMPECRFQQGYGTSETFTQIMLRPDVHEAALNGSREAERRLASIGVESTYSRVKVVDEQGALSATGEIGEIVVSGPMILSGYLNNAAETEDKLRDGWFYTGDLARVDQCGYVYLVDRKNNLIITGGENVFPAQVEKVLHGHPSVADVAVLGVPDERWGESVKAVVVLGANQQVTEQALIEFCRDKLPGYAKPKSVDFVYALPLFATGKLDRQALKNRYWGR